MLSFQPLPIHGVSQQYPLRHCLAHRNRCAVAEGFAVQVAFVRALEGDVQRRIHLGSRGTQHGSQGKPGPFRVADGAGRPGVAGHGPHALQVRTAVSLFAAGSIAFAQVNETRANERDPVVKLESTGRPS